MLNSVSRISGPLPLSSRHSFVCGGDTLFDHDVAKTNQEVVSVPALYLERTALVLKTRLGSCIPNHEPVWPRHPGSNHQRGMCVYCGYKTLISFVIAFFLHPALSYRQNWWTFQSLFRHIPAMRIKRWRCSSKPQCADMFISWNSCWKIAKSMWMPQEEFVISLR